MSQDGYNYSEQERETIKARASLNPKNDVREDLKKEQYQPDIYTDYEGSSGSQVNFRAYCYRWLILILYAGMVSVYQMVLTGYSPL